MHSPLDAEIVGMRIVVGVVSMEDDRGRIVGDDDSDGHGYVVICASTFIDAPIRREVIVAWIFILCCYYYWIDC